MRELTGTFYIFKPQQNYQNIIFFFWAITGNNKEKNNASICNKGNQPLSILYTTANKNNLFFHNLFNINHKSV